MTPERLQELIVLALRDAKAEDVVSLDVRNLTDLTDYMIIATGTSNRHVHSVVQHVAMTAKQNAHPPASIEGANEHAVDWVLLDFGDVVTHVMRPAARKYYDLEDLWTDLSQDPRIRKPQTCIPSQQQSNNQGD